MNPDAVDVSMSVVSHGQMAMVRLLLGDIQQHCQTPVIQVILTINTQDEESPDTDAYAFSVIVLRNIAPLGFGANHNKAFAHANGKYFCVVNPDIRLTMDPLGPLVVALAEPRIGVAAPAVYGLDGLREDSARRYPTPFSLFRRLTTGRHASAHMTGMDNFYPPWVGGMFMLFPRHVFAQVKGFDERFFLYYEDVDLCARLQLSGWNVVVTPVARVTHNAQRSSHKNLRFFRWHVVSLLKFLTSATFMRLWIRGLL